MNCDSTPEAVKIGDMVYDHIRPEGMPHFDWIRDLSAYWVGALSFKKFNRREDHMNDEIICRLLDEIRVRSGMYLGEPSIRRLRMYIAGYWHGVREFSNIEQDKRFFDFTRWIEIKFNNQTTIGWAEILIEITGDDEKAFDYFWQIWDEYNQEIDKME